MRGCRITSTSDFLSDHTVPGAIQKSFREFDRRGEV
jgi:hypothetical protein